nr:nucleotide-binding alpha-beta plait domain-containing protein [Tanacetum cinerariifolium]
MGSYRSKEDDVSRISTSIYVCNFPESFSAKDLFHSCKQYGHVVDTFIPFKRSKDGKRFGFVLFINVFNVERLMSDLCTILVHRSKFHANIARFHKAPLNNNKVPTKQKFGYNRNINNVLAKEGVTIGSSKSYVHAVKVKNMFGALDCDSKPSIVLDDKCLISKDLSKALLGRVKDFASLPNLKIVLKNEGFAEIKIRIVWVEIEGIPFKLWSNNTFKRIAAKWGELLDVDDQEEEGFHSKRLCIYSKSGMNIYEIFKVIFRGKVFLIRAKEVPGWVPEFVDDYDGDDDELDNGFTDDDAKFQDGGRCENDSDDVEVPETMFKESLEQKVNHSKDPFDANVFNAFIAKAGREEVPLGGSSFTWCYKSATKMSKLDSDGCGQEPKIKGAIEGDENTRKFWSSIENDVFAAVSHFFTFEDIPNGCNSCFIALILKVPDANLVKDFRPISLIGKRQILDGPFILNEVIQWYKLKKKQSLIFKVDFEKAYDSVRWDFLDDVLKKFGFGNKWCAWIQSCFRSSRGSIIINGSHVKEFQFFKGIKQGDPLPPFLFILIMESLHLSFQRVVDVGMFKGINLSPLVNLSHMFYADDAVFVGYWCDGLGVSSLYALNRALMMEWVWRFYSQKESLWERVIKEIYDDDGQDLQKLDADIDKGIESDDIINKRLEVLNSIQHLDKIKAMDVAQKPKIKWAIEGMRILEYLFEFSKVHYNRSTDGLRMCRFQRGAEEGGVGMWSSRGPIIINGSPVNEFQFFKRIKQGDPLPPFLFILNMESLHLSFQRVVDVGMFKGINLSPLVNLSHMFYVDDEVFVGQWCDGIKVLDYMRIKLENEESTAFWDDNWIGGKVLMYSFPRIYALETEKEVTVNSKMSDTRLENSFRRSIKGGVEHVQFNELSDMLQSVSLMPYSDMWVWSLEGLGEFSVASIQNIIDDKRLLTVDTRTLWIKYVPIKVNVLAWKIKIEALLTRFNISRRGIDIDSILCPICECGVESVRHVFFSCSLVRQIVRKVYSWWDVMYIDVNSYVEWLNWMNSLRLKSISKLMIEGVFYVVWWHVQMFRNKLLFEDKNHQRRLSLMTLLLYLIIGVILDVKPRSVGTIGLKFLI